MTLKKAGLAALTAMSMSQDIDAAKLDAYTAIHDTANTELVETFDEGYDDMTYVIETANDTLPPATQKLVDMTATIQQAVIDGSSDEEISRLLTEQRSLFDNAKAEMKETKTAGGERKPLMKQLIKNNPKLIERKIQGRKKDKIIAAEKEETAAEKEETAEMRKFGSRLAKWKHDIHNPQSKQDLQKLIQRYDSIHGEGSFLNSNLISSESKSIIQKILIK